MILEEARKQGDTRSLGTLAVARANALLAQGKVDEAERLLREVLPIMRVQHPTLHARCLLLLAESARRRGAKKEALQWMQEMQDLPLSPTNTCELYLAQARTFESGRSIAEAEQSLVQARNLSHALGTIALEALASVRLGALRVRKGGVTDAARPSLNGGDCSRTATSPWKRWRQPSWPKPLRAFMTGHAPSISLCKRGSSRSERATLLPCSSVGTSKRHWTWRRGP